MESPSAVQFGGFDRPQRGEDRGVLSERDADLRARLEGRVHDCWERLDDVVSELIELHGVPVDEIVERVRDAVSDEDISAAS